MRVAVVGAGFAGLAAAYDLARCGHRPVVFEASSEIGGLASGFRAPGWEWKAERFYHHVFTSDRAILDLTREIGASDVSAEASEARPGGRLVVRAQGEERFDAVLATTSPSLLSRLAPELPSTYGDRLAELDSLGAVALALALDRAFLDET